MAFKNPFSKKNTFWYNKFAFVLNQIQKVIDGISAKQDNMVVSVTLTQAEYDALITKDPHTLYVISDAQ